MKVDQIQFPFATAFDHPESPVREINSASRTRQEFKRDCDINYILARVGAGLQQLVPPEARFVDVSEVPTTYEECYDLILEADGKFAALPSSVRERFHNSPAQLFDFLRDEKNREEAVKLGLLVPPAERPAKVVSPAENAGVSENKTE